MDRHSLLLIFMCLGELVDGKIILDVHPNVTDVRDNNNVTIRCSLDLMRPKTEVVYSVMIKRRGTTSAVLFKDGSYEVIGKHVTVESSMISRSTAFLKLNLHNITCVDRGDYSCKMAVRRSYRNHQLGPVTSPLKVIGEPSGVVFHVDPEKTYYTFGEQVHITCFTLQRAIIKDWTWFIGNHSLENKFDSCVYSESDCLFKCSSTTSQYLDDEKTEFVCGVGAMSSKRTIDITDADASNDSASTLSASVYENNTHSSKDAIVKETTLITIVIPVTAAIVIITGIVLLLILGRSRLTETIFYSKKNGLGGTDQLYHMIRPGHINVGRKKDHLVYKDEELPLT